MNRILIIGATGNVGRQVLSQLPATGVQVRALTRNPDAARLPPQVEVVRGDLTLPETLDGCLDGSDTVFLVWCAPPAAVAPALERIAKHARRIVFLSSPHQTAHPFFQQPNPVRGLQAQIERLIGTAAAVGLILFFVAAIITHLRARDYSFGLVVVFLLLAVAALVLGLRARGSVALAQVVG
jgi:NAD(P)-dependent dehydrogenase (short-subunit alcohol dehydrogenase family)